MWLRRPRLRQDLPSVSIGSDWRSSEPFAHGARSARWALASRTADALQVLLQKFVTRLMKLLTGSAVQRFSPMAPKHCMASSVTSHAISVATTFSIEISWRISRPWSIFQA